MDEPTPSTEPPQHASEPARREPLLEWRLLARRASSLLLGGALAMALYVPATMAQGWLDHRALEDRYDDSVAELGEHLPAVSFAAGEPSFARAALELGRRLEVGEPFARLQVDKLDLDEAVVAGASSTDVAGDDPALRAGPAMIDRTKLPGLASTVGIAGHRTTYTAPFWSLEKLAVGDEVVLELPYGRFTYEVVESREVEPTELAVIEGFGEEQLTLVTCTPRFSAARRLAVRATLVDAEALGSGAGGDTGATTGAAAT